MTRDRTRDPPRPRGVLLRALLVLALEQAGRPCSIGELEAWMRGEGFSRPLGRSGKAISDALSVEVRRQRVRRVDRGRYRLAQPLDRRTRHRARSRVRAALRGEGPPSHLS